MGALAVSLVLGLARDIGIEPIQRGLELSFDVSCALTPGMDRRSKLTETKV
jgi:hypothetical protein